MGRRIRWLGIALVACFALLLVQITNVQFRQANKLATAPENPKVAAASTDQPRGDIIAADGQILATSVAAPKGSANAYTREYPGGSLYSQVVGFDSINYGMSGVEASYDKYLVAHQQPAQSLSQLLTPTTSTDTVALTIEPKLQALARQELAGRVGAVVALDPSTGAVLAMYGNPTYDPNPLASQNLATEISAYQRYTNPKYAGVGGLLPLSDIPYAQIFSPGSTFKVVTGSAVLDHQPALANFQVPVESHITIPGSTVGLTDADGPCGGTMAQMLPPSCDTGFATLALKIGAQTLYTEANSFGFNTVPPIDIPGAAASVFPHPSQFSTANLGPAALAYSAIGQENVSMSALQNALDAAAIANDGVIMTPHVVSQVRNANGNVVMSYQPTPWRTATSPSTAQTMTSMMQAVVSSPNGTGHTVGFLPQDQVAAKTGTAQAGSHTQYDNDWMIAFAPATHPKVAIAVALPYEPGSTFGDQCAGPVLNAMIQMALSGTAPTTSPLATCP